MIYLAILLCGLPSLLLTIDFVKFLVSGKRLYNKILTRLLEVAGMLVLPILHLWMLDEKTNDCCSDSATFSPDQSLTIYIFIAICIITGTPNSCALIKMRYKKNGELKSRLLEGYTGSQMYK